MVTERTVAESSTCLPATMLEQYFTDTDIVRRLSRRRAKCATAEHEHIRLELIASLGCTRSPSDDEAEVRGLFPPRARWARPRMRGGLTREQIAAQSAFSAAMQVLNSSAHADEPHTKNLRAFINGVRQAALGDEPYVVQPPQITPRRKEPGSPVYRAVARLALRDVVVEGTVAKYLQRCFGPDLLDCSFAYRCGSPGRPAPTHHDAMRAVMEFLAANAGKEIWIVEVDIRKFFDVVGHEAGQRAAVGLVGPLLLEGEKVLLQHLVKRSFLRLPAGVGVAGRLCRACRCLHRRIVGKRLTLLLRLPLFRSRGGDGAGAAGWNGPVPGHSTRQPDHTMSRPADAHLHHIGSLGTPRSRLARLAGS